MKFSRGKPESKDGDAKRCQSRNEWFGSTEINEETKPSDAGVKVLTNIQESYILVDNLMKVIIKT